MLPLCRRITQEEEEATASIFKRRTAPGREGPKLLTLTCHPVVKCRCADGALTLKNSHL